MSDLPRATATHVVTVGGLGDDTSVPLESVQAGLLLDSGRFAVLSGWKQLLIYGPDGRQTKAVGGEGEGPGEFQQATRMGLRADGNIWVWDLLLQRLSELSPSGELLDSRAVYSRDPPPPQALGLLDDGSVVASQARVVRLADQRRRGVWRNTIRYLRQTADGRWTLLADVPGPEMYSVNLGDRVSPERVLFGATTIGTVNGDYLYLVDTAEPSIVGMRGDGTVTTRIHLRLEGGQVPAGMEDKERRRRSERYEYLQADPLMSQVYELWRGAAEAVPVRDVLPPIRSIRSGVRDELWLQLEAGDEEASRTWLVVRPYEGTTRLLELPDASRTWLVVRPYEGTTRLLELPDGHGLLHATSSSVLTRSVGALGEHYVSVFERSDGVVAPGRGCLPLSGASRTHGGRPGMEGYGGSDRSPDSAY
ncbi:hypothetical protein [Candidatus Palauibacter sp.]|uniref:hypothetical protein n=1 Tax=Candidatus Palauibacter sp. TaxID=3101350 RepID=UPI003B01A0BD